jgi:hypothetical protein
MANKHAGEVHFSALATAAIPRRQGQKTIPESNKTKQGNQEDILYSQSRTRKIIYIAAVARNECLKTRNLLELIWITHAVLNN